MALNINKALIAGRLTAAPELKTTTSGVSVCNFKVAVNRRATKGVDHPEADFFTVIAWRNQADFVAKYFGKGDAIYVSGRIENRTWTDQQGQKRTVTEIVADEVNFVESKRDNSVTFQQVEEKQPENFAPNFEEIKTDDDLPF